jgi:hypothetical protein
MNRRDLIYAAAFAEALRAGCHGQTRHRQLEDGTWTETRIDASAEARRWADEAVRAAEVE